MGRVAFRDFGSPKRLGSTQQAIQSDRLAKKSYDNLLTKGLKNTSLLLELIGMAGALANEREKLPKCYRDAWSASGKTAKTLVYFPKRVNAMASEIEKLIAHPLFIPDQKCMEVLPKILRNYAEHVESRVKLLRRSRTGRPETFAQVLIGLRWLVRNETGKERHADVARLLTAVANDPGGFDFEAALKMNARRHPIPLPEKK